MFQSFQSFLAFLFALLTVYTLIRALRLDSLLDPARDFWKRMGKMGRVCATASVVFLAGHAVSKELLRGGGGNANLPDWFIALQYNPADTDGDGIPDCWERWTRTNPAVADANLDRDGDGVDNFGEFWNQCDPLMKDTDGDGYSDKLEIEGRAAGKTWFNPIVRAVYEYDDPDLNSNGVPDRWEGLGYVYGYTDANNDGLPDWLLDYKDELQYRVDGLVINDTTIETGEDEPEDLFPEIHHVSICTTDGVILDRLWIVILCSKTRTEFNTWASGNATNST